MTRRGDKDNVGRIIGHDTFKVTGSKTLQMMIQYLLGRSHFFLTLLLIARTRPYSGFAHCSAASRNAASRVVSR